MDDQTRLALEAAAWPVDAHVTAHVIALSPAISLGHNMLALSGALSRAYTNAATQDQLNAMVAMSAAVRSLTSLESASNEARASTEAIDLMKQVFAGLQAN